MQNKRTQSRLKISFLKSRSKRKKINHLVFLRTKNIDWIGIGSKFWEKTITIRNTFGKKSISSQTTKKGLCFWIRQTKSWQIQVFGRGYHGFYWNSYPGSDWNLCDYGISSHFLDFNADYLCTTTITFTDLIMQLWNSESFWFFFKTNAQVFLWSFIRNISLIVKQVLPKFNGFDQVLNFLISTLMLRKVPHSWKPKNCILAW